jgi:hypothetical protein
MVTGRGDFESYGITVCHDGSAAEGDTVLATCNGKIFSHEIQVFPHCNIKSRAESDKKYQ